MCPRDHSARHQSLGNQTGAYYCLLAAVTGHQPSLPAAGALHHAGKASVAQYIPAGQHTPRTQCRHTNMVHNMYSPTHGNTNVMASKQNIITCEIPFTMCKTIDRLNTNYHTCTSDCTHRTSSCNDMLPGGCHPDLHKGVGPIEQRQALQELRQLGSVSRLHSHRHNGFGLKAQRRQGKAPRVT